MKHTLLTFFIFGFSLIAQAQCEPMADFGNELFGVSPDTIANFAPAEINVLYVQQIDVKVPTDGSFVSPEAAFASIDSISIVGIVGMPSGLDYECAALLTTPCTIPGGETGCGLISGVPTESGTFDLQVQLIVWANLLGNPIPIDFVLEGYRIEVSNPLSSKGVEALKFAIKANVPNPARDVTSLSVDAPNSTLAVLTVYDLVGKPVEVKNIWLNAGSNRIPLKTGQLPTGLYVYRIDAFGESLSSRFAVAH